MTSFAEATAVKAVDSHTYSAYFYDDWCIGSVPHGGFVTSVFQRVATTHFNTTLSRQNQPHTLALHLEFLRRTQVGPATFVVKDVKLGRQATVIHVTLSQDNREEVVGYITHSNIPQETGVSFATGWSLHPAPAAVDLAALAAGKDQHWQEQTNMPFAKFRKASSRMRFFFPRGGQHLKSMADEWLCFRDGSRFTNESLGYVADMWPQVVESYRHGDDPYDVRDEKVDKSRAVIDKPFWYPTLLLNLDVKKALPEEGVEWLFARVRAKQIKNGRLDLEVVVLDEGAML
ncbi:hypothetical protein H2199_003329 [Coniosporium tulheliwenetii]|uniref:Uncharacterized protein n=1 Tax=Coniosporium tulheliwenetii TaxID=3383036 RepID=A0ACC2ZDD6_9PEZI|nr:hypothetical protein H2199_003329 [Cladosporium sp. JES 115]